MVETMRNLSDDEAKETLAKKVDRLLGANAYAREVKFYTEYDDTDVVRVDIVYTRRAEMPPASVRLQIAADLQSCLSQAGDLRTVVTYFSADDDDKTPAVVDGAA